MTADQTPTPDGPRRRLSGQEFAEIVLLVVMWFGAAIGGLLIGTAGLLIGLAASACVTLALLAVP